MSEVLLPFAKHVETGKIVSVEEVGKGKACGCVCLFCEVPMQARKGSVKREHFAHIPRDVKDDRPCKASFERSLFWMARRILQEGSIIELPEYEIHLEDFETGHSRTSKVTKAQGLQYDDVSFPENKEIYRDTAILQVAGKKLGVSLYFEKAPTTGTLKVDDEQVAHLAIQMSVIDEIFRKHKTGFRERMEKKLLKDISGKEWVYHPREIDRQEKFREEVDLLRKEQLERLEKARRQDALNNTGRREAKKSRASKAEIDRRHSLLVQMVLDIRDRHLRYGYICSRCKIMNPMLLDNCKYCRWSEVSAIEITDDYCRYLDSNYWYWKYAKQSVDAVPEL